MFRLLMFQNQIKKELGVANGFLAFIICMVEKMRLPFRLDKMKLQDQMKQFDYPFLELYPELVITLKCNPDEAI